MSEKIRHVTLETNRNAADKETKNKKNSWKKQNSVAEISKRENLQKKKKLKK